MKPAAQRIERHALSTHDKERQEKINALAGKVESGAITPEAAMAKVDAILKDEGAS